MTCYSSFAKFKFDFVKLAFLKKLHTKKQKCYKIICCPCRRQISCHWCNSEYGRCQINYSERVDVFGTEWQGFLFKLWPIIFNYYLFRRHGCQLRRVGLISFSYSANQMSSFFRCHLLATLFAKKKPLLWAPCHTSFACLLSSSLHPFQRFTQTLLRFDSSQCQSNIYSSRLPNQHGLILFAASLMKVMSCV